LKYGFSFERVGLRLNSNKKKRIAKVERVRKYKKEER
jgi:hypothetical protein